MDFPDAFSNLMTLETGTKEGAPPWGMEQALFSGWLLGKALPDVPVLKASRDLAMGFAMDDYWQPMRCGDLPDGLDFAVFQCGYNIGPVHAVKILQESLGVTADGIVGPVTIRAAAISIRLEILKTFLSSQDMYYNAITNPADAIFKAGWHNRVARTAVLLGINL
jgi:lysozyme family protein